MEKKKTKQPSGSLLNSKEPVKLRWKQLVNGNKSLYLDIYNKGKRHYEFLKLYLVPEANKNAREHNRKILTGAFYAKAKRTSEIIANRTGMPTTETDSDLRLIDVVEAYAKERIKPGANEKDGRHGSIMTLRMHLIAYAGENTKIKEVDKDFCIGFANYLKTAKNLHARSKGEKQISAGTAHLKYSMLCSVLNDAVRKGYIDKNPTKMVPAVYCPKKPDTERDYLTAEEIRRMIAAQCMYRQLKNAFLFSCFTGLRKSDIMQLRWSEIIKDNGRLIIYKRIQKTQRWLSIPLSGKAIEWLPKRNRHANEDGNIFKPMSNSSISDNIRKWALAAGIKHKRVSFHTARHTFATLELSLGADLYTVSKLLGHSSITTTQVYAKVVDKQKEQAVSLIDRAFKKKVNRQG